MDNRDHILLVEDEEHLAVGIKYNLEAEGYRVTIAGDGATALSQLNDPKNQFAMLILDIMLPGMSGYSVCEEIRNLGSLIPVLLLSARTLPEDRARGFDVGANQYLTKPFDLDELLSRVRNLLRLGTVQPSPPADKESGQLLAFGRARIDFDTHEVWVDDDPLKMTKLELDLLHYFWMNQGRVISREELLEEVWNVAPHVNTRAPDQFIRRLRKAFELEPSEPQHFLTVRDAGYRFLANADEPSDNESPA